MVSREEILFWTRNAVLERESAPELICKLLWSERASETGGTEGIEPSVAPVTHPLAKLFQVEMISSSTDTHTVPCLIHLLFLNADQDRMSPLENTRCFMANRSSSH
jgi:hypothetical protein